MRNVFTTLTVNHQEMRSLLVSGRRWEDDNELDIEETGCVWI
jgi:hypothetical protein